MYACCCCRRHFCVVLRSCFFQRFRCLSFCVILEQLQRFFLCCCVILQRSCMSHSCSVKNKYLFLKVCAPFAVFCIFVVFCIFLSWRIWTHSSPKFLPKSSPRASRWGSRGFQEKPNVAQEPPKSSLVLPKRVQVRPIRHPGRCK